MSNPLMKKTLNVDDFEAGLRHIRSESERVLDAIENHKKKSSGDSEMEFVLKMSGLEIAMTNLAKDFRESFIA